MATLTPQDIARLKAKMHHLAPMSMELFEKQLTLIDEDYPFTIPTWLELTLQIGTGATLLAVVGALLWFCIKQISPSCTVEVCNHGVNQEERKS